MKAVRLCNVCDNSGWVCENHPDKPWAGFSERSDACDCGAGMACRVCNAASSDERPDMSHTGMKIDVDIDRQPGDDLEGVLEEIRAATLKSKMTLSRLRRFIEQILEKRRSGKSKSQS